jgi:hypothetical protein
MKRTDMLAEMDGPIYILSGEGEVGTWTQYDGPRTTGALLARLKEERARGDRWARAAIYSHESEAGPVGVDFGDGSYVHLPAEFSADETK